MSETTDTKIAPLEWLRANVKLILLGLNAVVLVVLCLVLVSQALFELDIRGLLKKATAIEQMAKKDAPPKESPSSSQGSKQFPSDPSNRKPRSPDREGSAGITTVEGPTSQTTVSGSVTVTSATVLTSGTTTANAQPSSATQTTSGPIAAVSAGTPTSATVVTSPTLATSPTALAATLPTSGSLPSSGTIITRGIADLASHTMKALSMIQGKTGSGMSMEHPPRGGDRRPPMGGGPEDEKKREMFAKLEKRALFGEPRPAPIQPQLEAVLGGSALINGQWLTVGGKMGDWTVAEIGTDRVVMRDADGKRRDFGLMLGEGGGPGGPMRMGEMGRPGGEGFSSGTLRVSGPMTMPSMGSGGMQAIPDSIFLRLTGPGGRFEGLNREQLQDRLRQMRDESSSRESGNRDRGNSGDRGSERRPRD